METTRYHSTLEDLGARGLAGDGHRQIEVGRSQVEKCVAALTKLLVPQYDSRGVGAFSGLREAYVAITGDSDIDGLLKPVNISKELRSCQDFNSTTFAYALQNAMNVSLARSYKGFPYHEEILISEKKRVTDFRLNRSIQFGYFGELPTVDPEAEDYKSLTAYADSEAQYGISQKGAIVWVTRHHIIGDNIGVIQSMVERMARSARMAHAKYVWNFYKSNALCPDGTAWFALEHGNLGADGMDTTSLAAAITALANMTEPGPSGEKIGLDFETFNWNLVVPIGLWSLAVKNNQSSSYYPTNDLTTKDHNPCRKLFGERNERIVVCQFLEGVNEWGVIRDREDVPIVEMSYMNGQEVPEFITDWAPSAANSGASSHQFVFKNDKLGFKLRHEYGGTLVDFRGAYKAITD